MKGEKTAIGIVIAVLLAIAIITVNSVDTVNAAFEANDTVTISINISQIAMVDINPSNLSYQGIGPGDVGDNNTEVIGNYSGIWVENIGSVNLTKMWFNTTSPSTMPFGTGNPNNYDAANMIVIYNDTTGNFSFVNRVEFPENDSMYITTTNAISASQTGQGYLFGRFRNASNEYFFEFEPYAVTNCSNGTLWISDTAKTITSTGDTDLTDNTALTVYQHPTLDFGITEVQVGDGPHYCVAIPGNCGYVMFHRWNADAPGAGTSYCSNTNGGYYINSTTSPIFPGQVEQAYVKVYVPLGTPYGPLKQGTLTVFVQE